jgi:hypothetical protein
MDIRIFVEEKKRFYLYPAGVSGVFYFNREQMQKLLVHTLNPVITTLVPGSPTSVLCLVFCCYYLLPGGVNILKAKSVSGQLNIWDWMSLQVLLYGHIACPYFILFCLRNCAVFVYLCIRAGCIIGPMRLRVHVNKIKSNYCYYLMWFVDFYLFLYVHICGLLLDVFSLRFLTFLYHWSYGSCVSTSLK